MPLQTENCLYGKIFFTRKDCTYWVVKALITRCREMDSEILKFVLKKKPNNCFLLKGRILKTLGNKNKNPESRC